MSRSAPVLVLSFGLMAGPASAQEMRFFYPMPLEGTVSIQRDVQYAVSDTTRLRMDRHVPGVLEGHQPHPVPEYVRGETGFWKLNQKRSSRMLLLAVPRPGATLFPHAASHWVKKKQTYRPGGPHAAGPTRDN